VTAAEVAAGAAAASKAVVCRGGISLMNPATGKRDSKLGLHLVWVEFKTAAGVAKAHVNVGRHGIVFVNNHTQKSANYRVKELGWADIFAEEESANAISHGILVNHGTSYGMSVNAHGKISTAGWTNAHGTGSWITWLVYRPADVEYPVIRVWMDNSSRTLVELTDVIIQANGHCGHLHQWDT
jgi:hypothetical protein